MASQSARLAFILSLTDKVTGPANKIKNTITDLADAGAANIVRMGAGFVGLRESFEGVSAILEPALEMNRALSDVRAMGTAEDALSSLNAKALEFSVQYGASAVEFVSSARSIEGAIQGLVGNQLATVTNASSVLAKATKSDTETTSQYLGSMYNLFKSEADKVGRVQWVEQLTSQTALAVKLFRTDGAQLKDAFKEAGAIATASGVSFAEQMAVIGTLSSTMEGGDAGGRYKAFFENIGNASEKLGMKFTDANGKVLPMLDILGKLQGKFGDLKTAAGNAKLVEAFGGEGAQVIGALAMDTDRLKNGIAELGKVRGLENAEKMAQAMVDPWQQFSEAVQALRIAFGQALIPMLTPLMNRMVGIAQTLTRWSQLFPNITKAIGIATLVVFGLIAAMSALTLVVGMGKMVWLGLVTVWNILTWTGFRSIAMFLYHTVMVTGFVAGMVLMYTWMGLVRVGMLLWQGAIWLVNAAMLANPVLLIVAGIVALGVVVAAAIVYWDQWTGALMNTEAFQWISAQLQALSDWFGTIGGWTGMASAAWDGIVAIFKDSINALVGMLNKIPGVEIDAVFSDLPKAPDIPGVSVPVVPTLAIPAPPVPSLVTTPSLGEQAEQTRQRLNQSTAGISPRAPTAVPPGGLLRSIQNTTTNNSDQGKKTHIDTVNINTSKPMTPLEMENLMNMAAG
ncbi:phage tail tape measure protein [Pseudomonas putida]|uniref:phage tail tape measure protein n=1 Tax=Pseudomonas putida group TaxID=136845 RepID=UPI0018A8EBD4|nr:MULTISPECIES: phage tail tape measure protein [Pseudomonas putida group]MBF8766677.1 phage tail tape measure protein [Pseudomonas putida]MEC4022532.1 phage tail tape measure protein [Pseudomonas fulva]